MATHKKDQKFINRSLLSSCVTVLIGMSSIQTSAEQFYMPELISSDPQMVADLSRFVKNGAQLPGSYTVDIYINQKWFITRELDFIDIHSLDDDGINNKQGNRVIHDKTGLIACLNLSDLEHFGINIKSFLTSDDVIDERCIAPGKYIPDAFTVFDFQSMRLDISIPQAVMRNQAQGSLSPDSWDEGINTALLNYIFNGNTSHGHNGDSRSHYLNLNSGINLGPWRLRDYRTWNYYDSPFYTSSQWQRVRTYAERHIISLLSSLVLGDSNADGDVFDSLGFRGAQLASDDSMHPDSLRGFAPVIKGIANTNAEVSVRQNGFTVYQVFVSPGAFTINDLFPVSSSGDFEVTVKEADGSVQSFTVPYSSVPILQREGRLKYSLTAGRYNAMSDRYHSPKFVQGTLIWGLPHNVTLYGGVQYSPNYKAGLLGGGFNLGAFGALSADITVANSQLADGSRHQGQSIRFLYARSLNSFGTTFQLTGYRYSTKGFHTLDETALKEMSGWRYDSDMTDAEGKPINRPIGDYYNLYNTKKAKIQATISQQISEIGSIYLSGIRQTYWNTSGASDSLQVGFNGSAGRVNYNISYNYTLESRNQNQSKESDQSIFLSLSMPIFIGNNSNSIYASYNTGQDKDKKITHQVGLSGTLLDGDNLNWNLSQSYSHGQQNSGSLSARYQGAYGNSNIGYSYSENYRQVNYGVSGGIMLHSEGITFGQPVGESSVLIAAPGISNVAIENEIGVKTDWRGYAIKPYAAVYRENRVALNLSSLGDDTDVDNSVTRVIPTRGAVVRASFQGHKGSRVLMKLTYNNKPIPFGSMASIGDRSSLIGDEGQVYLSGIQEEGVVQVKWGDQPDKQCKANYRLPIKDKSQPLQRLTAICI